MDHQSVITPWDLECMLCDEAAEPKALPLSLLKRITHDFSDEQAIGRGGFAVVYKVQQLSAIPVLIKGQLTTEVVADNAHCRECLRIGPWP